MKYISLLNYYFVKYLVVRAFLYLVETFGSRMGINFGGFAAFVAKQTLYVILDRPGYD